MKPLCIEAVDALKIRWKTRETNVYDKEPLLHPPYLRIYPSGLTLYNFALLKMSRVGDRLLLAGSRQTSLRKRLSTSSSCLFAPLPAAAMFAATAIPLPRSPGSLTAKGPQMGSNRCHFNYGPSHPSVAEQAWGTVTLLINPTAQAIESHRQASAGPGRGLVDNMFACI